jgi:chromosome segregation protein
LNDPDAQWPVVLAAVKAKNEAANRALARLAEGSSVPMSEADVATFVRLDEELGEVSRHLNASRQDHVQRAASTQSQVISILIAGAVLGAGLCLLGLISMRHWVVQPIGKIRHATRRIAQGEIDYRLPIDSDDELGRLSAEINHTCSTIQDMQRRLVEQERLAAAGEMFARLAHNIRNPLASIRGLAEATAQQLPQDVDIVECQRRIINTVDRFEKWLRDMQQSVSPMSLNLRPTPIAEPIDSVTTALGPLFDRRGVRLEIQIDPAMPPVLLDPAHFEQGLVAIVTNAIQASAPGQRVRISVRPLPGSESKWQLTVEDQIYRDMRARLDAMGPVNMMALEEYKETAERHAFLETQRKDLYDSIENTQATIKEIDTFSRQKFEEAFHKINENFQATFRKLFGGGQGFMRLTDEENSAESGIDVVASPPGKKLQNVLLLSGGEKALTALALLVGIFQYQPSPFCILDEVDAPLDEANIGRFTELVKEMSIQTQFVLITHSKKTMSIAPVLYGVTMQEPGVSKLVSVRFGATA